MFLYVCDFIRRVQVECILLRDAAMLARSWDSLFHVCLSVCLSHRLSGTRVTKRNQTYCQYRMKGQSIQFFYINSGWWVSDIPFDLKFALKVTCLLRKTPNSTDIRL